MSIKLTGATSGSIELDVPAAVSGGDISLTLPNGVGTADQVLKTAALLERLSLHNRKLNLDKLLKKSQVFVMAAR